MKRIFLAVLFSTGLFSGYSQVEPENNTEPQQPKVIIYNAEEPGKDEIFEPLYLVKLNLISALSGDMGLSVEKKLGDKFSAEAGLGVTVRNFSQGLIVNFFEINDGINDPQIERVYKLGPSVIGSFKYYPNGAIDEFFFGPEIRYRRYNSQSRVIGERGRFNEFISLADFKINVGYINFIEDNIFIEYNAGLGIRNRVQKMLSFEENNPDAFIDDVNLFAPLISFGLKIGFVAD